MVYFRSSILLLLYVDKIKAGTTKQQKQSIKQYQSRFRAAFPGETFDPESLQVIVESSVGVLSPDSIKKKRNVDTTKTKQTAEDFRYNEPGDAMPDYDTPLYDEDGNRMKLDPALKSKLETGRDRKRSRQEHQYYREEYGYECYDTIEDQYFRAGDKWTTVRNLTDHTGVVAGISAYYSCTCEGGDTGRYLCRPTQVPCYSKYTKRYHEVGSQFDIKTQKDEYLCYCYGGATGRYECEEKAHGCYDENWTHMKYGINEKFEQVRADGLTYDCECQYGSRVQERVIICRLARYCQIDDDIIMIGDKFDIYGPSGIVQHRCTCLKGDRYTNKLECKSAQTPSLIDQRGRGKYDPNRTNKKGESDESKNNRGGTQTKQANPNGRARGRGDDRADAPKYETNQQGLNPEDAWEGIEPLSIDELELLASEDYDHTNWDDGSDVDFDASQYPDLYE